jgi:hypothetical protein
MCDIGRSGYVFVGVLVLDDLDQSPNPPQSVTPDRPICSDDSIWFQMRETIIRNVDGRVLTPNDRGPSRETVF